MIKKYISVLMSIVMMLAIVVTPVSGQVLKVVKVSSVSLNKSNILIYIGNTETLKATVLPASATNKSIRWISSNKKIATVDSTGVIKAVGVGKATVTGISIEGCKYTRCVVNVIARPIILKPVYNGEEIKAKVREIEGVFDFNGGLALNPYGKLGASSLTNFCFNVGPSDSDLTRDMNFTILGGDAEVDKKIRTILNLILPNDGNKLYSILDNVNLKSQVIYLGGRKVDIEAEKNFLSICFGPTMSVRNATVEKEQANLDWLAKNVKMTRAGNRVFYNPQGNSIWGAQITVANSIEWCEAQLSITVWIKQNPSKTKGILKFYFPTEYESIYSMVNEGFAGNGDKYLGKTYVFDNRKVILNYSEPTHTLSVEIGIIGSK
ncbi:Ig-like domain-containing protein [Clostridium sp.]